MSSQKVCGIVRGGYVRSVFMRRLKCHAVPLDLLRALIDSRIAAQGWRRRVSTAFAGYLVSDDSQVACRVGDSRPVWRDFFTKRAVLIGAEPGGVARRVYGLVDDREYVFAMDAPDWMPAGGVEKYGPDGWDEYCAMQKKYRRGGG